MMGSPSLAMANEKVSPRSPAAMPKFESDGTSFDMPNIPCKPSVGRPARSAAIAAENKLGSSGMNSASKKGGKASRSMMGESILAPQPANQQSAPTLVSRKRVMSNGSQLEKPLKALRTLLSGPTSNSANVGSLASSLQPKSSTGYHLATAASSMARSKSIPMGPKGLSANAAGNRTNSKAEKGLRHFSAKVCAKVEEKGCTSYNEVADELVQEMGAEMGKMDNKNIRRRVYDALNVLMAIDVIEKDRKEIRWLGLSNDTTNELSALETEFAAAMKRVEEKQKALKDLIQRKIALHGLIERNTKTQNPINGQILSSSSILSDGNNIDGSKADRLYLPFILINAPRDCRVHCEMLEDRTQYFFEFDMTFFINEDIELLRLMGLDNATPDGLRVILPPDVLQFYLTRLKPGVLVEGASLPLGPITTAMQTARVASHPGRTSSHRPSRYLEHNDSAAAATMSSPVFSRHTPRGGMSASASIKAAAQNKSSLREGSGAAAKPTIIQEPIGYTGIFRKTSSAHQLPPLQPEYEQEDDALVNTMPFLSDPFGQGENY